MMNRSASVLGIFLVLIAAVSALHAAEPSASETLRKTIVLELSRLPPDEKTAVAAQAEFEQLRFGVYCVLLGEGKSATRDVVPESSSDGLPSWWPERMKQGLLRFRAPITTATPMAEIRRVADGLDDDHLADLDREMFRYLLADDLAIMKFLKAAGLRTAAEAEAMGASAMPATSSGPVSSGQPERLAEIVPREIAQAYRMYLDESVPGKFAIAAFERCLVQYPQTPFQVEIHCIIGYLYTIHCRPNEVSDLPKAAEHFMIAHRLYDGRYDFNHCTIWGTLANAQDATVQFKSAYYAWLLKAMQSSASIPVFPVRSLAQCLAGQPLLLNEEERFAFEMGLRKNLGSFVSVGEKNILASTMTADDLRFLAMQHPQTWLGKEAARKLSQVASMLPEPSEPVKAESKPARDVAVLPPKPVENALPGAPTPPRRSPWWWVSAFGACLLVILGWGMIYRRGRSW